MLIADRYEATGGAYWGGMAEVHEFLDKHLERQVVLKRIIRASDADRLLDEQKALLSVRSKHVVDLLDIVEYDYSGAIEKGLILEFIPGSDLQEGSMVMGHDYIKVLWQIAAGLTDIHDAKVIHRDIKPANIRVDTSGVVKIIDFGLSRHVGVDDKTRSIIGSFGYLAPELARKDVIEFIEFTTAVDVYAFGATALSLLVPVLQQSGPANPELAKSILSGADPQIIELIASCLEQDPINRPGIARVRDDLAAFLLIGQHRAWLNNAGTLIEINTNSPSAKINAGVGTLEIRYSGRNFIVHNVTGAVNINRIPLVIGQPIPSSCVIIFGLQGAKSRAFITFDASNPAVMA